MSCQREWALVMKIYGMNFWCVLQTSALGLVCLACILAIHCWYFYAIYIKVSIFPR
jgi:hypothetical protein